MLSSSSSSSSAGNDDSSCTTDNKSLITNITEFDVPTQQLLSDGKLVIEFRVCRNDYNHHHNSEYDDDIINNTNGNDDDDHHQRHHHHDYQGLLPIYHTFTINDLKTTTTQQLYDLAPKTFDPILIEMHCCDNALNEVGDDEEDL